VADALSVQLQVLRNNIHVTCLRPGEFAIVFRRPPEHIRTCSPPAYRQARAADMEPMEPLAVQVGAQQGLPLPHHR
jgi:hypothetical protein